MSHVTKVFFSPPSCVVGVSKGTIFCFGNPYISYGSACF